MAELAELQQKRRAVEVKSNDSTNPASEHFAGRDADLFDFGDGEK
jgi:hypothetical protein